MTLDKLTLNAQLAMLTKNAEALDTAIAQKVKTLQDVTVDLERTRGARAYHDLLVQQVNNQLAEISRSEAAAVTPA